MAKYILVKKVKGQKFEYQVIDTESKAIVSKRTSARDYVACTADGSFYFGRLDLIGKGDHGKRLSHTAAILANPEAAYKKQVAYFTPDYIRLVFQIAHAAPCWERVGRLILLHTYLDI